MIERLLELQLSGFRCFLRDTTIPLDADVVLIYGSNGTGKTSILAGLEYALTGTVEDLAVFEHDYPRCLKHALANAPAKVSVRYVGNDKQEMAVERETDILSTPALSQSDKRFFRDRCYLSQRSLGRLLENYQMSSKDDPEQPLVRFVRELLGLDLLENLTSGLHEAGNVTRIEKSVPALAKAREDQATLEAKRVKLHADLLVQMAVSSQAVTNCQAVITEAHDPLPGEPWTHEGVLKRLEVHSRSVGSTVSTLNQLRSAEGKLHRALGLLSVESSTTALPKLQDELTLVLNRQKSLEARLTPLVERALSVVAQGGFRTGESELGARFDTIEAELSAILKRRKTEEATVSQASVEIAQLRERQDSLKKQLQECESERKDVDSAPQRWAEVLGAVLQYVTSEKCPVCNRDYSELSQGDLRAHILGEIERVGADAKRMAEQMRRKDQLVTELGTLDRRLAAMEAQFKSDQERQAKDRLERPDIENIATELGLLAPSRREWAENLVSMARLRSGLAATEVQDRQKAEAVAELEEVFRALSLPEELRQSDPRAFAASAADAVAKRADLVEKQAVNAVKLREVLEQARDAGALVQKTGGALDECLRNQRKAQSIEARLRRDLESARSLSRAAARAKTRLLHQVFNEKLNTLWSNLFHRLVKQQQFQPRLAEPKLVRGTIRTTIEGCLQDVPPFEQFAAVASSGNLNTAALSLFLSLNLIEQPRHQFIVLDDPVQAMDDLHVMQLANVLREIQRQSKRQLIVAVHERALFDYLSLQLGPTDQGTSMLGIELNCIKSDQVPEVVVTRHVGKPDRVRFGS